MCRPTRYFSYILQYTRTFYSCFIHSQEIFIFNKSDCISNFYIFIGLGADFSACDFT